MWVTHLRKKKLTRAQATQETRETCGILQYMKLPATILPENSWVTLLGRIIHTS